jgi:LPXTG-motif cell wall-anchored protein
MTNSGKRMISAVAATAICLAALFGTVGSAQADNGRIDDGIDSQQVIAEDASPPILKSTVPQADDALRNDGSRNDASHNDGKSSPPTTDQQQSDSAATAQQPSAVDQPDGTQTSAPDTSQTESGNGTDTRSETGNDAQQGQPASDGAKTLNSKEPLAEKTQSIPQCAAGYIYGIRSEIGQIIQVAPNGGVTLLGSPVGGFGSKNFNGLGIGTGGSPVYAFNRSGDGSDDRPMIYRFDTATGTWGSTGTRIPAANSNGVTFIAGAVDLDNGHYFLGGYASSDSSRVFRLWEYAPGNPGSIVYKGSVATPGSGNANGDIAFDTNGNLFIVRGSGNTTTVYSVTAANLAAANGGTIAASPSNSVSNTTDDVNGIAFDSTGKGYLAGHDTLQSYDMPGWTGRKTVTSSLGHSTDLASCGSPPTIAIEKVVQGGRAQQGDQFKLTLNQGGTQIANATTTGNAAGVQPDRIGPLPTVRGVPLTFAESAAGTTNMSYYASSYRCLVDGVQTTQGNGISGSITIPARGQAVECQFYNAPLTANVAIHKDVKDGTGATAPRQGWSVGAQTQATAGTATVNPTATTQTTNANGDAAWKLRFGTVNDRATVSVSETQQTGYQFDSGSCVVTHLDGTTSTTALTGTDAKALGGVKPGDNVQCTYVNKTITTLTVIKKVANKYAEPAKPDDFKLTATQQGGSAKPFASGVSQNVQPGSYEIGETLLPGYQQDGIACKSGSNPVDVVVTDGKGKVTVPDAQNIVCTVTNSGKPGSVTWEKTDDGDSGTHLSGSQWTLTGPGVPAGTVINDCVTTGNCGSGAYDDQDPRPGYFQLKNQNWANGYVLKESKAPAGYERSDDEHQYSISASKLDYAFAAAFVNKQRTPPTLPLTGGMSTDAFIAIGGVLVASAIGAGFVFRRRLLPNSFNPPNGRSSR